jgi:adenosine kinase
VADPSQQLAFGDGELIRGLVEGASILFTNEYESHVLQQKTGWSAEEVIDRVEVQVITLGKDGVRVERKGEPPIVVPACPDVQAVEPTGVGDAFRAGFLGAVTWGLSLERAAQFGCVIAAFVVETVGTQEYKVTPGLLVDRMRTAYGDDAAADVAAHLS